MKKFAVYADMTIPAHETLRGHVEQQTYKGVFLLERDNRHECEEYIARIVNIDSRFANVRIE